MQYSYNSKPISQITPGAEVKGTDEYVATDTTDLTQSPSGSTKKYTVDSLLAYAAQNFIGNDIPSARVGTVSDLNAVYVNGEDGVGATLTNNGALVPLVIDGVLLAENDRVLVSFQTNAFENGVYIVTNVGTVAEPWVLTRATDYDGTAEATIRLGDYIAVIFGSNNALSWWFQTSPTVNDVGVDPITFQRQSLVAADAWVDQTTDATLLSINTGYTSSAGVNLITYTLPINSSVGSWIEINGSDTGLYQIAQTGSQVIHFGNISTTPGPAGSIASMLQYDNIRLRCTVADTEWTVVSSQGNFTVT